MEKKTTKTKSTTRKRSTKRNYSGATVVLLLIMIIEAAMMCLPCFGGNNASSMLSVLKAKDLYGVAVAGLLCLPLAVMFVAVCLPVDVIKKYVICFFMSVWMLFGYMLLSLLFKAKFAPAKPSVGLIMGIVGALALFAATIIGNITDKSPRKHKDAVWYNGFNRILLFISLPMFASMAVAAVVFKNMLYSFPTLTVIGVFTAVGTLAVCSFVSICSLFGKNKPGILYYITAFTSVVAIMSMFIMSGSSATVFALLFAVVLALFFIYLGHIAKRTYF
ncbi:MAG: hypothetical protein J5590_05195 [Clostridia bacterium]|nr:hypothetical protein [Clostridia bacterium]